MRIDAHQHYWKIDRGDYGWITPDVPTLYRDFMPEDLQKQLQQHQIDYTILVQAAPTIEETEFLLQLSDKTESVAGVVGWLNLEDRNYKSQFQQFDRHSKFVGFRLMIQDMEDATIILTPNYIKALNYFTEKDVPIDLLVTHDQLPVLNQMLERVPDLRGVIDHIGKPAIRDQELESWKKEMEKAAKYKNIYCKISGMVTEADYDNWKKEAFVPYIHHILQVFGKDRVIFGSDWPVCLLAGSYDEVIDVLQYALPENLSATDEEKLFGSNAMQFYKLGRLGR